MFKHHVYSYSVELTKCKNIDEWKGIYVTQGPYIYTIDIDYNRTCVSTLNTTTTSFDTITHSIASKKYSKQRSTRTLLQHSISNQKKGGNNKDKNKELQTNIPLIILIASIFICVLCIFCLCTVHWFRLMGRGRNLLRHGHESNSNESKNAKEINAKNNDNKTIIGNEAKTNNQPNDHYTNNLDKLETQIQIQILSVQKSKTPSDDEKMEGVQAMLSLDCYMDLSRSNHSAEDSAEIKRKNRAKLRKKFSRRRPKIGGNDEGYRSLPANDAMSALSAYAMSKSINESQSSSKSSKSSVVIRITPPPHDLKNNKSNGNKPAVAVDVENVFGTEEKEQLFSTFKYSKVKFYRKCTESGLSDVVIDLLMEEFGRREKKIETY